MQKHGNSLWLSAYLGTTNMEVFVVFVVSCFENTDQDVERKNG